MQLVALRLPSDVLFAFFAMCAYCLACGVSEQGARTFLFSVSATINHLLY